MMTEAELWQLQLMAVDNTIAGLQGIASITFAYLVAAFFVGGKLSRSQAALATVFYVLVASLFSLFTVVQYRRAVFFIRELSENYGIRSLVPNDVLMPVLAIVLAMLIPACIYFMYQVRKNARLDDASD